MGQKQSRPELRTALGCLLPFTNPPLTTIAQPKYEMGILAAQMLMERIKDKTMPPRRHLLETTLVIRDSCHPRRE
ncbi:MAG TPA: hypothetical protein EYH32_02730 [Anaerolineae bacterium]|nr:hypothetical protein [Anaerolineae bacterium]